VEAASVEAADEVPASEMTEESSGYEHGYHGHHHVHHHHHHHHGHGFGFGMGGFGMGGFGMGGFGMGGFGMFSNCGLGSFYRQKKDLRWAKELFQQADDESWLKGLLEKSEIDSEQFEWLKDLFEKHHQQDVDGEANQWWRKHFEGKADDIDSESMPNWLQQHSQKEKEFNWSWNSEH